MASLERCSICSRHWCDTRDVTALNDHGDRPPSMIQCPVGIAPVHSSLTLALRDMRTATARDEETGDGPGNASWIGLSIGMTVLDTLTKASDPHRQRMLRLLTAHGVEERDAEVIYHLRNSVLHGYWLPKNTKLRNRRMLPHREQTSYALDTTSQRARSISAFQYSAAVSSSGSHLKHKATGTRR